MIAAILIRCNLNSFYRNGTIIRKLTCYKNIRIFYFTLEILFNFCFRVYGLIAYYNDRQKCLKSFRGSDLWFWAYKALSTFVLIAYIWLLTFTNTFDKCFDILNHSTLYVGENYHISESKSKEVEKSKEGENKEGEGKGGENKLEVLDYFGAKKFEESEIPSISCSKSENSEQNDDFGSYC